MLYFSLIYELSAIDDFFFSLIDYFSLIFESGVSISCLDYLCELLLWALELKYEPGPGGSSLNLCKTSKEQIEVNF